MLIRYACQEMATSRLPARSRRSRADFDVEHPPARAILAAGRGWTARLVAGGAQRQTSTLRKVSTMNCILDICGDKKIRNPSETDIRQAAFGLDTKKGDAFLI